MFRTMAPSPLRLRRPDSIPPSLPLSGAPGRAVSRVLFPRSSLWDRCRHRPQAAHPAGSNGPGKPFLPIGPCTGWGLPCPSLLPSQAVGSYPTVSPLPAPGKPRPLAVSSLWHFPSGYPAQPLAGTLPYGARTFLTQGGSPPGATARPPWGTSYSTTNVSVAGIAHAPGQKPAFAPS